jgi:hypothetical protein
LVGAFENPVTAEGGRAISTLSAERLAARATQIDAAYGLAPAASFVLAGNDGVRVQLADMGESVDLDELVNQVRARAVAVLEDPR